MAQTAWLTWLPAEDADAPPLEKYVAAMNSSGYTLGGARWVDDLDKYAWGELASRLSSDEAGPETWVVAGRAEDFASTTIRYGLSMTLAMIQSLRKTPPHVVFLGLDGAPDAASFPTLWKPGKAIDGTAERWAAKLLIQCRGKSALAAPRDFRLNVIAHSMCGQWFEVGPVEGEWKGGMFGVSEGGAIQQHGVGKANELPKKTILEYPIDDIKAEVGGHEFNAVACQNKLEPTTSYFIQAQGHPQHLMFGGHPEDEDAEAWVVTLA
ncbi:MAG: hypothetical protein KDD82_13855 [Planctomycetes bacterium]|nr:hypothetical protein [Planctomycetota bacterium]